MTTTPTTNKATTTAGTLRDDEVFKAALYALLGAYEKSATVDESAQPDAYREAEAAWMARWDAVIAAGDAHALRAARSAARRV